MNHPASPDRSHGQRGFAMLVLLAVIGAGSIGILLAVQVASNPFADRPQRTERNMAVVEHAARAAFRANGAFPTTIDALATTVGLDAGGSWRTDPWFAPGDLDYRNVAGGRRVLSRGPDRRRNTADDVSAVVAAEPLVRARQRERLRLIRAVLLRSRFYLSGTMTPTDVATVRDAFHRHANARRAWLTADAATRTSLQATLAATESTIATMRLTHGLPALPSQVTGGAGLMAELGMPDTKAVDGNLRNMVADPLLGVLARGYDRTGGTDDDM